MFLRRALIPSAEFLSRVWLPVCGDAPFKHHGYVLEPENILRTLPSFLPDRSIAMRLAFVVSLRCGALVFSPCWNVFVFRSAVLHLRVRFAALLL